VPSDYLLNLYEEAMWTLALSVVGIAIIGSSALIWLRMRKPRADNKDEPKSRSDLEWEAHCKRYLDQR
jgi:hypothetical protein